MIREVRRGRLVSEGTFSLTECHCALSRILLTLLTDAIQVLKEAILVAFRGKVLRVLIFARGNMVQAK